MSKSGLHSNRVAIVGTVGVPAIYGGFETLAENIVMQHSACRTVTELIVYCSGNAYLQRPARFRSAQLVYVPLDANGVCSVLYDLASLVAALRAGVDCILLLGVSGAIGLPIIKAFSRVRIVTNIDGIEWRRAKWGPLARFYLRLSEALAVRHSDVVIADNTAIAEHVHATYGVECEVIAYGGDHAMSVEATDVDELRLPASYALSVCRIEPENNVHLILAAFAVIPELNLVCVGNWRASDYGRRLLGQFAGFGNIRMCDPIYDLGKLKTVRAGARLYLHGHSAGGTNPSLVEIMHFGMPVIAFDCAYNRWTTDNSAFYFSTVDQLVSIVRSSITGEGLAENGHAMRRIARTQYVWEKIAARYFEELGIRCDPQSR